MRLGALDVLPVMDGQIVFDAPPGVPSPGTAEFEPHRNYLKDGRFLMDIGAFVVRTTGRVLLLDTGAGPGSGEPCCARHLAQPETADPEFVAYFRGMGLEGAALHGALAAASRSELRTGALADNLAALGIAPDEITDVLLSHLHFDHIGWVSKDGEACFPNATYRCDRRDLDFFLGPDAQDETFGRLAWKTLTARERLAPVLDRIEPWDGDVAIAAGVNALSAPGHTPGSAIFVLSSGQARAMILGDSVHCPLELTDSEFSLMSDLDPALADRTREKIRRELEGGEVLASAPHFPDLRFGRMLPGQGKPTFAYV